MYYKEFHVAGTINTTEYDDGLMSPVDKPIHINAIILNTSAMEGNYIEGWIGTERVLEIVDYCVDTQEEATAFTGLSVVKIGRLPVELDIDAGKIFKVAIRCGATASNLFGSYEYEPQT